MKKLLQIALGVITAVGGFLDIGDLVFASQAGARHGFTLLWAVPVGVLAIMTFAEMSGRVATIGNQPVFEIIKNRYGRKLGLFTLAGSQLTNILTCAAEIGGVALVLQLLSGLPYTVLILVATAALIFLVLLLPFGKLERLFGYMGLGLLVFAVAAIKVHPDWGQVASGLVPTLPESNLLNYAYFAVGIIAATLMPYEVYFYSSGAKEEKWKPGDMIVNRANSILGFVLGGLLVMAIIITSAVLFLPQDISPGFINTPALAGLIPFGQAGLLLILLGMLFAIGGSALETCFSGAYNLAQFRTWKWGRHLSPEKAPKFTYAWFMIFITACLIIISGVDPITLTEYAVIFSVVVMPLTYVPVFMAARDKNLMGKYKNGRFANIMGWASLALILIVSVAAVPLMILTHRGLT